MGQRLSLGISEDRDFKFPDVSVDAFSQDGPYQSALLKLKKITNSPGFEKWAKTYWERCLNSGGTLPAADFEGARKRFKSNIEWILIYESEHARVWADGPLDYNAALRSYQRQAITDSARITSAIAELRRFDRKHPYLLRHSVQRAMQDFLAEEELKTANRPNANAKRGFDTVTVSGPKVREAEFQFLTKLSLFRFGEFLNSCDREIASIFSQWPLDWKEFGSLRFANALSPMAASKLDVVQLGLIAHLTSRLRDFTAGYGIRAYSTGQPIPTHGKPCWEVVAEFVNCALSANRSITGETARRIWQSISSKHDITMQAWPKPSKSESQLSEIPD
jgi:hypothetical protein